MVAKSEVLVALPTWGSVRAPSGELVMGELKGVRYLLSKTVGRMSCTPSLERFLAPAR